MSKLQVPLRAKVANSSGRAVLVSILVIAVALLTGPTLFAWATASSPSSLVTITPCRAVDTRAAPAPGGGPVPGGTQRDFSMISGNMSSQGGNAAGCGIPSTASGASLTITITSTISNGYVAAFPAGSTWGGNSTANWTTDNTTVADGAQIQLGTSSTSGSGSITIKAGGSGSTHVIVDITGYYTANPTPGSQLVIASNTCTIPANTQRACEALCPAAQPYATGVGTIGGDITQNTNGVHFLNDLLGRPIGANGAMNNNSTSATTFTVQAVCSP